jgi:hypothetical protein
MPVSGSGFPYLIGRLSKVIEPIICPLDLAREGFPLLCRQCAPMPSDEL